MENFNFDQVISVGTILAVLILLAKVFRWVGKTDALHDTFSDFMKEIRGDIKKILSGMAPQTVIAGSPLRLSPLGEHLASALKVYVWAHNMSSTLLLREDTSDQIKKMSEYEVQEYCMKFCTETFKFPDEQSQRMHGLAFENGIKIEEVKKVYAVMLRDLLIEKRHASTLAEEITDDDIPF